MCAVAGLRFVGREHRGRLLTHVHSGTWSTWSAVINRTSRAGELRSAPSGPDDWHRVAGKKALALGVRGRRERALK